MCPKSPSHVLTIPALKHLVLQILQDVITRGISAFRMDGVGADYWEHTLRPRFFMVSGDVAPPRLPNLFDSFSERAPAFTLRGSCCRMLESRLPKSLPLLFACPFACKRCKLSHTHDVIGDHPALKVIGMLRHLWNFLEMQCQG